MKPAYAILLLLTCTLQVKAQKVASQVDEVRFFEKEAIVQMTIDVNLRRVIANKMKKDVVFPAIVTANFDSDKIIREPVTLEVRGNFRKDYCYLPPLKINFKSPAATQLSPLGALKLVNTCKLNSVGYEYLLKEYLTYKIYNLLTDKSLRVRLLKINFVDSTGKRKPVEEYGFLIEDVKDMAKRNACVERKRDVAHTELTDRKQMTRVALFEYMIGNLDWSVPVRHNIKLIAPKEDSNTTAFPVPYDFDYSGLVKTDYAIPPPELGLDNVTVRNYRGFPRTMQELQDVAEEFLQQKAAIYKLISEFDVLSIATRKNMIAYLDDFYNTLSKPGEIKVRFLDNARRN